MKMLGIDDKFTTPYHLLVNIFLSVALCAYAHGTGKWVTERFNRTLQNMLAKFVEEDLGRLFRLLRILL